MDETVENKCWLCLRITPKEVFNIIKKLDLPKDVSHKIFAECVNYVKRAYEKKPTYFCGKSKKRIIGGLIYIMCLHHHKTRIRKDRITQLKILWLFDDRKYTPTVIRKGMNDWFELFPDLKSSLGLWRRDYN